MRRLKLRRQQIGNIYSHVSDGKTTKRSLPLIKRCRLKASSTLNILDEEAARHALSLPDRRREYRPKRATTGGIFRSPFLPKGRFARALIELPRIKARLIFPIAGLTIPRGSHVAGAL
jgi:hypothetical protein